MNKEYYDDYYRYERSHWWFRIRSRIIENTLLRRVQPKQKLRILNIGVATGASTQMLEKYGEVVSVEYDKDCYEFVRGILTGTVINASITELPFEDNSFDLVCAFDVVEHVADHELAVREMNRVCRPGGHLYVTVPAFMSLWSKHDVINHHERRYRRGPLRSLFAPLAGKEIYSTYFNSLLFPPIFIFRSISRLVKSSDNPEEVKSDFEVVRSQSFFGKIVNGMLGGIFSMELFFLRFMRFPAGVSILLLWKKN